MSGYRSLEEAWLTLVDEAPPGVNYEMLKAFFLAGAIAATVLHKTPAGEANLQRDIARYSGVSDRAAEPS